MSRKVHSEHIVATKVLMPVGGGGRVTGKVHFEYIVPTSARYAIDIGIAFFYTTIFTGQRGAMASLPPPPFDPLSGKGPLGKLFTFSATPANPLNRQQATSTLVDNAIMYLPHSIQPTGLDE